MTQLNLASLDGIPEPLQEHAQKVEQDGRESYVLDLTKAQGWELGETGGLRTALETYKARDAEKSKALEAYGDLKPDDVKASLSDLEKLRSSQGTVDEQIRTLQERHAQEKAELEQRMSQVVSESDEWLLDSAVDRALRDAKDKPLDLARYPLRQHLRVVEEDGKRAVRVVDPATGTPRVTLKGGAGPMDPVELIDDVWARDDSKASWFPASGNRGAGLTGDARGGGGSIKTNPFNPKTPNITEQMRLTKEKPELAARLQAEAAQAG